MKYLPLTLLIAIVLFSACQKEVNETTDPDPDPDPVPGQVAKRLVKSFYGSDNFAHIDSFAFDDKGRCVSILMKTYFAPGAPPVEYDYFYDFHYNGTDTLPYKITDTSRGRDMVWLIQYDAQQRKIVDSVINFDERTRSVIHYVYKSNQIIADTYQYMDGTPGSFFVQTDTFDYNGVNCTRFAEVYNPTGVPVDFQYVMTYDNNISPYSTLNIARSVLFGAKGIGIVGEFTGLNKNNPLSMVYSSKDPAAHGGTTTIQYVLDADGYPVSSSFVNSANPGAGGEEKFEYKK